MITENQINGKILEKDDLTISTLFKGTHDITNLNFAHIAVPFNTLLDPSVLLDQKIAAIRNLDKNEFFWTIRRFLQSVYFNLQSKNKETEGIFVRESLDGQNYELMDFAKHLLTLFNDQIAPTIVSNLILLIYFKRRKFKSFKNLIDVIVETNIFEDETQEHSETKDQAEKITENSSLHQNTKSSGKESLDFKTEYTKNKFSHSSGKFKHQNTKNPNSGVDNRDKFRSFSSDQKSFQKREQKDFSYKKKFYGSEDGRNFKKGQNFQKNFTNENNDETETDAFLPPNRKKRSNRKKKHNDFTKNFHKMPAQGFKQGFNQQLTPLQKDKITFHAFKSIKFFLNEQFAECKNGLCELFKFEQIWKREKVKNEFFTMLKISAFLENGTHLKLNESFSGKHLPRNFSQDDNRIDNLINKSKQFDLTYFLNHTDPLIGRNFFIVSVRNLVKFCYDNFRDENKLQLSFIKAAFMVRGINGNDWYFYLLKAIELGKIRGYVALKQELLVFSPERPFP